MKTFSSRRDRVRSGHESQELVKSGVICNRGLLQSGRKIPHNNRRSGHNCSPLVGDATPDCAG